MRLAEENVFLPARDHIFRQDCLVIDATGQPEVADLEERIKWDTFEDNNC